MRLLVESELSELLMSVLLLLPPVELELSELESSDSDPSTARTGPPSVSGGLFLSSVMVVPDESK
jgi:hypothetical protein